MWYPLVLAIGRPWAWLAQRHRQAGHSLWRYLYDPIDWWYRPLLVWAIEKKQLQHAREQAGE